MKALAYHDHNDDKWNKQVHDEFLKDKQKKKNQDLNNIKEMSSIR